MEIPESLPPQTRFSFWIEMDDLNDRHYTLSRVFLSLIGLWPYEDTLFAYVKRIFFILTLGSSIVFQIAALLRTTEYTKDQLLNTITNVALITVFIVKWCTFWHHMEDIKQHIEFIRDNWTYMRDENEQRIILKYVDHGMFINHLFTCCISLALTVYLIFMTCSNCSDATSDKYGNSIDHRMKMDYFTEGKAPSYVTLLHVYVVIVLGGISMIGTETTIMLCAHYVCGLYNVVCYHVKDAFSDELLKTTVFERNRIARHRLVIAAKIHTKVLQQCKIVGDIVGPWYLLLLIIGVSSLSLHLLCTQFSAVLLELFLIFGHLLYFFMTNNMGQVIMDNSSKVFTETYHTQWYASSVPVQKLFLYIMYHSLKNYTFRIGGLFTPSYEGVSTLIRMSFSYFTVIYSTQM